MILTTHDTEFISHVKHECRRHGVKLVLSDKRYFSDEAQTYGGYFSHSDKELAVADIGNSYNMLTTLVHEFSHMEQWIYDDPTFTHRLRGGHESTAILNNWLMGQQYNKNTIRSAVAIIRECELNCERRTIANIKKYKLSIDTRRYARNANAYILFHHYVLLKRKWDFDKFPLHNSYLVDQMPSDMDTLDYSHFDPCYKMLFEAFSE